MITYSGLIRDSKSDGVRRRSNGLGHSGCCGLQGGVSTSRYVKGPDRWAPYYH